MNTTTDTIRTKVNKFNASVGTIQDRLRVKSNLFGMEARQAISELSDYLDRLRSEMLDLENKAIDIGERINLQTRLGFMETEDRWNEIRKYLDEFGDQLSEAKDFSKEKFDFARVQAHLAKLDAKDALNEKIKTWKKKLSENKEPGSEEISRTLDKMLDGLENLLVKFEH